MPRSRTSEPAPRPIAVLAALPPQALVTPREAAALLATTDHHVKRLRALGTLPTVHVGGRVRLRRGDLDGTIDSTEAAR